jgi:hypothetical protein
MRLVKCVVCGDAINKTVDPFVLLNRRYAHEYCAVQEQVDKNIRKQLNSFIMELWDGAPNFGMVGRQINQFQTDYKYTLSGILGTLHYCYNVKKIGFDKAQGIGIVPYYYKEARKYFEAIEKGRANSSELLDTKHIVVNIAPPRSEVIRKINEIQWEEI